MNKFELIEAILRDLEVVADKYMKEKHTPHALSYALTIALVGLQVGLQGGRKDRAIEVISSYINKVSKTEIK
tara:strand:+ start:574 stop:789 length:216 start_codon:yes stop_codon:yes gene_type:complete